MQQEIKVTILTLAYNHEPYIRQCLDGFVMQKTNFRFEAIIHDDASTDGTATIIKEYAEKYPDIIKPVLETENLYSKRDGSLGNVMRSHVRGKYIATCEGDDYWIDPYKLQKQVDFLEAHPDYGMVYTNGCIYNQKQQKLYNNLAPKIVKGIDDLLLGNRIGTLSTLYRTQLLLNYRSEIKPNKSWKMGDYPLWLYIASHSKLHYINEPTCVYRMLEESASHSKSVEKRAGFIVNSFEIQSFFAKYLHKEDILDVISKRYFYEILCMYIRDGKRFDYKKFKNLLQLKKVPFAYNIIYFLSLNALSRKLLLKKWGH